MNLCLPESELKLLLAGSDRVDSTRWLDGLLLEMECSEDHVIVEIRTESHPTASAMLAITGVPSRHVVDDDSVLLDDPSTSAGSIQLQRRPLAFDDNRQSNRSGSVKRRADFDMEDLLEVLNSSSDCG